MIRRPPRSTPFPTRRSSDLATREKIQQEIGEKSFGAVTKVQAERWKTLPKAELEKYEKQAAEAKTKYEADLKAFVDAGGVKGQKRAEKKAAKDAKAAKKEKKEANADKPKKAPSAYFLFVNETRQKVQEEIGDKSFGAVTKVQAERWKKLPKGELEKYEKQAAELKKKYEEELKVWKEKKAAEGGAPEEEEEEGEGEGESEANDSPKKASPKKRGRPGKDSSKDSPKEGPEIEEHTSELQSRSDLVCRLLLEKKKKHKKNKKKKIK